MQFKISTNKEELVKLADSAEFEGFNNIETPGAYPVIIDMAELVTRSSNAKFMEIKFTTDDENKQTGKISILVATKAGKSTYTKNGVDYDLPGINMIRGSLMILAKVESLDTTVITGKDGKTHLVYKNLHGKRIGVLLDIKKTANAKKPGEFYYNQEIVGFYDVETNKTASELIKDEPATSKAQKESRLKLIDETLLIKPKTDNPFEEEEKPNQETSTIQTAEQTDFWNN